MLPVFANNRLDAIILYAAFFYMVIAGGHFVFHGSCWEKIDGE